MDNLFPNIPRLFTALAEWLSCMLFILSSPRQLSGPRLALAAGGALVLQCVFLEITDPLPVIFWIPAIAAAVGLMYLLIWVCSDLSPTAAGYCTVRAFILAEFAASLEWQLYFYTAYQLDQYSDALSLVFMAVTYLGVFALAWHLEKRMSSPVPLTVTPAELGSVALIALSAFFVSNLSFVYSNTPFSSSFITEIYNIRTLVDLAGLVILCAYHLQRQQLHTRHELDAIQNILQTQYAQYQQSKESIDLINRKYHDLKHQIALLRAESDAGKRSAFLDQMEQEIRTYEAQNKTGSSVLDTVLTSKSLSCVQDHIQLTCVADGSLLSFLEVMDICTIFGNALDNAMEHVRSIPQEEKRLIHVTVSARKGFVLLRFENYCQDELSFADGLPVTTKGDADYHGYGLKSIRYTAQKYGGSIAVSVKDHWFELDVLLPQPQTAVG